ncbi:DUF4214 domain-containing protein [Pseudomonas viridiflava]|uniref:DUF4214 domain-containing protein n=1 Tax=Pseudomonas viridiflava TaxID=33069 RepID=UPI000F02FECB|nr:DUF4214 domain-containing protein [Pseudomonas viridiflava]MEE4140294.1 DUF4214 domain-containing protein [Pseudomonas viridiflava]
MQYDAPVTAAAFNTYLTATGLSDSTTDAISSLLSLDSGASLSVAGFDGVNLELPAGQTGPVDVVTGVIAGTATDVVTVNVTSQLASAKAIILGSDASLNINITPVVAADGATDVSSLARVAVSADATAATQFLLSTGAGNDVLIVNGDQNNFIDSGDGNDTIITGNGNNTVVAGAGSNVVITGTGNDTVLLSGNGDVVNTGAGFDVVQLEGTRDSYTVTAGNNFDVAVTGTQAASITNAEFLTFVSTAAGVETIETVALVQNETEASALRLYEGILGRDADLGGAQTFIAQANAGTSLTDIANSFLNSAEFSNNATTAPVNTLYNELLGRTGGADEGGLANWQAVLANGGSLADVAAGIAGSAEAQAFDQSNGDFVRDLYTAALGRDANQDQEGLSNWVSQLFNGTSRAEVAQNIFGSQEAAAKADSDFIDNLYLTATGRASDAGGKATWTEVLANGGTHADVAIGIVGSAEAVAHNDNVVVLHGAV